MPLSYNKVSNNLKHLPHSIIARCFSSLELVLFFSEGGIFILRKDPLTTEFLGQKLLASIHQHWYFNDVLRNFDFFIVYYMSFERKHKSLSWWSLINMGLNQKVFPMTLVLFWKTNSDYFQKWNYFQRIYYYLYFLLWISEMWHLLVQGWRKRFKDMSNMYALKKIWPIRAFLLPIPNR